MSSDSYDFIIIGGGTAGLVLAARLSEDPNLRVLVIEAGADLKGDPRVDIPAMWPALIKTESDWAFATTPQEHLGGRRLPFSQGRALGGSSAINGHIFTPIPKSNVDGRINLGNPGWERPSFSQSLKKAFVLTDKASGTTSGWGMLQVSYPDQSNDEWLSIWKDTLAGLGFPVVDKIIFKDSKSTEVVVDGVQYIKDGHTMIINAQEVVLAAGAINSPMLLERSGIGSAELLRNLGISAIVDNPNVGENLQDHIIVSVSSEVKDNLMTMDPLRRHDPAAIAAAKEAYKRQSGPWSTGGTSVTAQLPFPDIHTDKVNGGRHTTSTFDQARKECVRSMVSSPDEASGCYITFPGWMAFNPDGSIVPEPGEKNYFSIILLNTHTLSRGSTHITPVSALSPGAVAVDPGYLSHPLDLELFALNLRFLETVLASEPLLSQLKLGGKRNRSAPPVGGFTKLDTARDYVRSTGLAGTHFVGSCSMMPREMGGVVDPQLRVYGVKNLRVCDASIIPLIPRANPQATIYGVAEHGAYIIKSGLTT